MGFDLTDKYGNEGRIPAWARGVLDEAVNEYYQPTELWYRGDIDKKECNEIANALEKAIDDNWFVRDEAIEYEKQWIQQLNNKDKSALSNCKKNEKVAKNLITFLRHCDGSFESV